MGYTHDTQMSQFIPPSQIAKTAGAWTPTYAANKYGDVRAAAAATFNLLIPIEVPSNGDALKGARLKSVDVWWVSGVTPFNSITTVELDLQSYKANGVAPSAAAVAATLDSDNDTSAKRVTNAEHRMTVTVTNPQWVAAGTQYFLYITFDAAVGTTFTLHGAQANYDLRV